MQLAGDMLADAIGHIINLLPIDVSRARFPILREGIIATAKLPNFAFDGKHPFDEVDVMISGIANAELFNVDDLYGSIGNKWSKSPDHSFTGSSLGYVGDGVSKSFRLVDPKNIQLKHWQ